MQYAFFFSKENLTISLLPPSELQYFLNEVEKAIQVTNPEHEFVLKKLYLCFDMKLIT